MASSENQKILPNVASGSGHAASISITNLVIIFSEEDYLGDSTSRTASTKAAAASGTMAFP